MSVATVVPDVCVVVRHGAVELLRPVVVVGEKDRKMNLRHVSRVLTHTLRSRAALSVLSDLSDLSAFGLLADKFFAAIIFRLYFPSSIHLILHIPSSTSGLSIVPSWAMDLRGGYCYICAQHLGSTPGLSGYPPTTPGSRPNPTSVRPDFTRARPVTWLPASGR